PSCRAAARSASLCPKAVPCQVSSASIAQNRQERRASMAFEYNIVRVSQNAKSTAGFVSGLGAGGGRGAGGAVAALARFGRCVAGAAFPLSVLTGAAATLGVGRLGVVDGRTGCSAGSGAEAVAGAGSTLGAAVGV